MTTSRDDMSVDEMRCTIIRVFFGEVMKVDNAWCAPEACRSPTFITRPRITSQLHLIHCNQLHFEHEVAVRGNYRGEPAQAVPVIGRARELGGFPDAHLGHPLVPGLNHLPRTDGELERPPAVVRAVELAAVGERACKRGTGGLSDMVGKGVDRVSVKQDRLDVDRGPFHDITFIGPLIPDRFVSPRESREKTQNPRRTCVVRGDGLPGFGKRHAVPGGKGFHGDAHREVLREVIGDICSQQNRRPAQKSLGKSRHFPSAIQGAPSLLAYATRSHTRVGGFTSPNALRRGIDTTARTTGWVGKQPEAVAASRVKPPVERDDSTSLKAVVPTVWEREIRKL